jgi:hypothetical protein
MAPSVLERRRSKRYNLKADLHYLALDAGNQPRIGEGRSDNMSSTGLLFRSNAPLPNDWRCCAVALKWPARPPEREAPPLMILFGYPVRTEHSEVALSVSHHIFLRMEADDAKIASLLTKIGSEKSAVSVFKKHSTTLRPVLQLVRRNF